MIYINSTWVTLDPSYSETEYIFSWHRYRGYDQQFAIVFQVLPPEE